MGGARDKLKTAGIIAEYDPFHNGHLYHMQRAREVTGADALAVVMSGHFMQRGTPSFFDRDLRVRMAIEAGADLVIELPYIYACGSSHDFALGGVGILNGLACIDSLVFGAETDDMETLRAAAHASADRQGRLSPRIKKLLASGMSYGQALTGAVEDLCGSAAANALRSPNNLLGIEYIKAIEELGSDMSPLALARKKAGHDDRVSDQKKDAGADSRPDHTDRDHPDPLSQQTAYKDITSGTGVRELFMKSGMEAVRPFIPETSFNIMKKQGACSTDFSVRDDIMFEMLRFRILTSSPQDLAQIAGVDEGIENRFYDAIRKSHDISGFIDQIKTRRYSHARLRRMVISILMNMRKTELAGLRGTFYARVMGFSRTGRSLLRQVSENASIPVFSNLGRLDLKDRKAVSCLEIDMRASDLFGMISGRPLEKNREIRYIPYRKQ